MSTKSTTSGLAIEFPSRTAKIPGVDKNAYALEVTGNAMLPVYRKGCILIVSPKATARRGDRVVVKTKGGKVMAKVMQRQTAKRVELAFLKSKRKPQTIDMKDIAWMARIIWASQ